MGWGYFEYVPVAEKKARAQKALAALRKKNPNVTPVVIEGRKIAKTWWGAAWNENLESYADYENRLARGSSYVRNGMILDLKIAAGFVAALVMGSRKTPYSVEIRFDKLSEANWKRIAERCGHKIDGLKALTEGRFPGEMQEMFLKQGEGLFPSPKEIRMKCSCPDGAAMCKHIAAVLYGIGAMFDSDPLLFFKLRGIPFENLLKKTVEEKTANMLKNAGSKTRRVLRDADIGKIFGISEAININININPESVTGLAEAGENARPARGRPKAVTGGRRSSSSPKTR
jgi:uncharacterized Zn finger protein